MAKKVYKNSPIVEAVCEFKFDPSSEWDLTIPGLLYPKLEDDFPKKRARATGNIQIRDNQAELSRTDIAQFFSEDEKAFVQVYPHTLSVNVLTPYPSWKKFGSWIRDAYSKYIQLAEPKGISRIGLRYINVITLRNIKNVVNINEYLKIGPAGPPEYSDTMSSFNMVVEFDHEGERDRLRVALSSLPSEQEGEVKLRLDLDYYLNEPNSVDLGSVAEWVEAAHSHVEDTFEASIQDKLRARFNLED